MSKTFDVARKAYEGVIFPNAALDEVCKLLLDEYDLSAEQIANLALAIPGECEDISADRSEKYWSERSEPDDSAYRRDMINAGRGHLLK